MDEGSGEADEPLGGGLLSSQMRATLEACDARAVELGEVGRRVVGDESYARAVRRMEGLPEVYRGTRELAIRRLDSAHCRLPA